MSAEKGNHSLGRWRDSKNVKQILERPVYRPGVKAPKRIVSKDPKVLIEQAIARTGSVEKAAIETGEPLRKVQAVYDAMLKQ
jgi:hypothetical protein